MQNNIFQREQGLKVIAHNLLNFGGLQRPLPPSTTFTAKPQQVPTKNKGILSALNPTNLFGVNRSTPL